MAVRSQPLNDDRSRMRDALTKAPDAGSYTGTSSAKPYSSRRIADGNRAFRQWAARGILGASFIGSVLTFNGGITAIDFKNPLALSLKEPLFLGLNIYLMLVGLAVQCIVTRIEWENVRNKWSLWYIGAFLVDMGTTYVAFSAVLLWMALLLLRPLNLDEQSARWVATALGLAVAGLGAFLPENELVGE